MRLHHGLFLQKLLCTKMSIESHSATVVFSHGARHIAMSNRTGKYFFIFFYFFMRTT